MDVRRCSKCKKTKPLFCFSKDKTTKTGFSCKCKQCDKIKRLKYKRSKTGLITLMYHNQVSNAKKRGRKPPNYSRGEFISWVIHQTNFNEIYNEWVRSGYKKDSVPSCDRITDYSDYTLDNIKLTTWKENNHRHYQDVINGKNRKNVTPIIGIKDGIEIRFYSISHASRETGIHRTTIYQNIKHKERITKKFKFKYDKRSDSNRRLHDNQ